VKSSAVSVINVVYTKETTDVSNVHGVTCQKTALSTDIEVSNVYGIVANERKMG
jgi:hypothetical protein